MAQKTRKKLNECPILGLPSDFALHYLPTNGDVLKACLWHRFDLKTSAKEPDNSVVFPKVISKLIEVWNTASIPIVSKERIKAKLTAYYGKYKYLLGHYQERRNHLTFKTKLEIFQIDSKRLFDIASCKCLISLNECKCPN